MRDRDIQGARVYSVYKRQPNGRLECVAWGASRMGENHDPVLKDAVFGGFRRADDRDLVFAMERAPRVPATRSPEALLSLRMKRAEGGSAADHPPEYYTLEACVRECEIARRERAGAMERWLSLHPENTRVIVEDDLWVE